MLTKEEYLLTCLMEECAELAHDCSKAIRFGSDDYHPKYPGRINKDNIMEEFTQLIGVFELLRTMWYPAYLNTPEMVNYTDERITEKKRKLTEILDVYEYGGTYPWNE